MITYLPQSAQILCGNFKDPQFLHFTELTILVKK